MRSPLNGLFLNASSSSTFQNMNPRQHHLVLERLFYLKKKVVHCSISRCLNKSACLATHNCLHLRMWEQAEQASANLIFKKPQASLPTSEIQQHSPHPHQDDLHNVPLRLSPLNIPIRLPSQISTYQTPRIISPCLPHHRLNTPSPTPTKGTSRLIPA